MRFRKRHVFLTILAISIASMLPAIARTTILAQNYVGLFTIASLSEDDYSFLPWNSHSLLISPNTAVTILSNFDWPYRERNTAWSPPLHLAVITHVLVSPGSPDSDRVIRLINSILDRGEPIDEYDGAYTPLLLAILNCDERVVRLLVARGANFDLPFEKKGSPAFGLGAIEFAKFLHERKNYRSSRIYPFLNSHGIGAS